ncbi:zinc ribbon domain-containing protein [Singulisphaera sp. PoT]|uniref:zinc ribbon domain-containing protein n=1 Tax=Singulisphaera sp. PoT TaxID=3411797 RepID=UPI003BF49E95
MYCSECGTQGLGKFCTNCGTRLAAATATALVDPPTPAPIVDWPREVRYDLLIAHPEVRERLSNAGNKATAGISAEQAMKFYDKFLAKAVGGVELSDIATIAVPILTRMGLQATKQRSESFEAPPGRTIVAALCSLAARGQKVKEVYQASDGCAIEAVLPSDLWSWEGTLFVTVASDGHRSRLDARTKIGGQVYDWGKSNRCLDRLVQDVRSFR